MRAVLDTNVLVSALLVAGSRPAAILEAAVEADADYIVTGDGDLLRLGEHQGVRVVTPARFTAILAALQAEQ